MTEKENFNRVTESIIGASDYKVGLLFNFEPQ